MHLRIDGLYGLLKAAERVYAEEQHMLYNGEYLTKG